MKTNNLFDFLFRKAFMVFLIFAPLFNALAASDNPFNNTDNIEPPPAAPIDGHVFILFLFGIGLLLYHFYKTKKKNAFG
jgi:hypothetical protein